MLSARPVLALILSLVLWTAVLRVPAVYAYYFLDTSDFIERLCENKDKPKMNCNGKCYLSKMLQADQQAEDEPTMPIVQWSEFHYFFTPPVHTEWAEPWFQDPVLPLYRNGYTFSILEEYFRPPPFPLSIS